MIKELATPKALSSMKMSGDGYVMISDDATGDKIHKVLCNEVEP